MTVHLKKHFPIQSYWKTLLLLIIFTFTYSIYYLNLTQQWWFEDDPLQFHKVSGIDHVLDLFISPHIVRDFGTGNALVPMQILSYWLDVFCCGFSAKSAYWHSLFSLAITSILLFLNLIRYVSRPGLAFCIVVTWLLLPTTISTHYFLATRHYIEGFMFSLLAMLFLDRQQPVKLWRIAVIVSCALIALLYKEVYATFLPTFLFLISLYRRQYGLASAVVAFSIVYAAYRLYMIGSEMHYVMEFLDVSEYLRFLSKLPFIFTAGDFGYLLYAVYLICMVTIFIIRPQSRIKIYFFLLLWLLALATIYPVSLALLNTYQMPGTWYRALFLFNTILICSVGLLVGQYSSRHIQLAVLFITLASIIPGTVKTKDSWLTMMSKARIEGTYYLSHPDRLLYSEEPAHWYLVGLNKMYQIHNPHFIHKHFPTHEEYRELLLEFPTIWSYQNGEYQENPDLFKQLRRMNQYPES